MNKARAMRASFIAAPGMALVVADYAAMELMAAGSVTEDQAMNASSPTPSSRDVRNLVASP